MADKRLLLISYLFPPAGGIAVQRALSLAKYLPQNGFTVHVLHAKNAAAPVIDNSLVSHIPPSVQLHGAFAPEVPYVLRHAVWGWLSRMPGSGRPKASSAEMKRSPGTSAKSRVMQLARRILCPEPEVLWVPFAIRAARRIIRQHGITHLMVTVPPFSALLAGNALKREFPDVKYVSDFRDEWITFYLKDFEYQNNEYTRRRAVEIERETVERSDLVVAVTESSLHEIRNRYPAQPASKFACVFNGYDPDALQGYQSTPSRSEKIVVTHMGTVYKTASPKYYLDVLDAMPAEVRNRIETRFIGRIVDTERAVFEGRKSDVKVIGFLPQSEALKQLSETDYLLLTLTNDISLPGKLFEYMATEKPILALSPPGGEVDRILRAAQAGTCVDPFDSAAIASMLRDAIAAKENGDERRPVRSVIDEYSRPNLTRRYAELMSSL